MSLASFTCILLSLFLALLSGCVNRTKHLELEDNSSTLYKATIKKHIKEKRYTSLKFLRNSAEDDSSLESKEGRRTTFFGTTTRDHLHFDELEIFGPAELKVKYTTSLASANAEYHFLSHPKIDLNLGLGVGKIDFKATLDANPTIYELNESSLGLNTFIQFQLHFLQNYSFSAEAYLLDFHKPSLSTSLIGGTASIAYKLSDKINLEAGYYLQNYANERYRSHILSDTRGFLVGINTQF